MINNGQFKGLQGVIINDCSDPNAKVRQQVRFASLFGVAPAFVEVGGKNPDLEAAGHLVDILDAATTPDYYPSAKVVVLLNVAPRDTNIKHRGGNGTPFCYFKVENAIVVSTFGGRSLSLIRKLGLVDKVQLLHVPDVVASLVKSDKINQSEARHIANSQFRSYEFSPLVAYELVKGSSLPATEVKLDELPSAESRVWFTDNFGNVKTTILPVDVKFEVGKVLTLKGGQKATCYDRLADVPKNTEFGIVKGSSGYGHKRWLELVQQGKSAADNWGAKVGARVLEVW